MDRQQMMDFAQRLVHAPDNDARITELVALTPDATLARIGLARRPSTLGTVLSLTGAAAVGALIGAGAALLLAPTSGPELQRRLGRQAKRISRDVQKASDQVEEKISDLREQVASMAGADHASAKGSLPNGATSGTGKRQGAHA